MEDFLLPRPLSEKFMERFLNPTTLRVGEELTLTGFIVNPSFSEDFRSSLWPSLSPLLRDFKVMGITPFPQRGFPVLPLVVPYYVRVKGRVGEVTGKVMDLSDFSHLSGRFLLVENFQGRKVEDIVTMERPGLDGGKILRMFGDAFEGIGRDTMLAYFLSSSRYLSRVGGCTVSFLEREGEDYGNPREFSSLVSSLHPILRNRSFSLELVYEDITSASFRLNFPVRYDLLNSRKAMEFYTRRGGREWERSAMTSTSRGFEDIMALSEIPAITYRDEDEVQGEEIVEYSVDIAAYALWKHMEMPEIDQDFVAKFKGRFLGKMENQLPLLTEAMRYGVLMDLSDVNGFGEHIGRVVNSFQRLNRGNWEEMAMQLILKALERIEDSYQDTLRKRIASMSEKKRLESILNRVLWELNTLKPEGWDFFYFQRKLEERGVDRNAEKILNELITSGYVRRVDKERYLGVASL